MSSFWNRMRRTVGKAVGRAAVDYAERHLKDRRNQDRRNASGPSGGTRSARPHLAGAEPAPDADHARVYDVARLGLPPLRYAPHPDDLADPGEVVWTWIPYEEDPDQGKDRPVLVLARIGSSAVVAQMTSQDHDRDADQEARYGRHWMDIGSGDWDARHRASEVRLDRLVQVPLKSVRRTGGALDRQRYNQVATALRTCHSS